MNVSGKVIRFADTLVPSSFVQMAEAFSDKMCNTWLFLKFQILVSVGLQQTTEFGGTPWASLTWGGDKWKVNREWNATLDA